MDGSGAEGAEFSSRMAKTRAYHLISAEHLLTNIEHWRFKWSTYGDMNDPFEMYSNVTAHPVVSDRMKYVKRVTHTETGVFCCSRNYSSTLLWSHYADKHTGAAMVVDIDDNYVSDVIYSQTRSELSLDDMFAIADGRGDADWPFRNMRTKSAEWKYEDEIRVFGRLKPDDSGLHFHDFEDGFVKLSGVILGALCTLTVDDIWERMPLGRYLFVGKAALCDFEWRVIADNAFQERKLHKTSV